MEEVNEIVNESNVHLDIQTNSESYLVNYFKYLVQASNELQKLYQYIIESAALVELIDINITNTGQKLKFC